MSSDHSQKGFVLVATIWTLAAVTLAAGFLALWTQSVLQRAREGQEDVQALVDMNSTQATLLYLFAVQRINLAGLSVPVPPVAASDPRAQRNALQYVDEFSTDFMPAGGEIALDDTVYKGLGRARFSIQDEGGLVPVNFAGSALIENLLGLLSVPVPQRIPLVDKLLDYKDEDDLVRLNGAEAADYKKNGLPLPPNRLLLTSWEAHSVLGWKDQKGLWRDGRFGRLTSTVFGGTPNPNTAPDLVLKTIPGVDDETARRIKNARKLMPFASEEALYQAAGKYLGIDEMGLRLLPYKVERISLWREGGRRMKEIHIELTPFPAQVGLKPQTTQNRPWVIDYTMELPLAPEQESANAQSVPIPFFASPLPADPK